jgi:putative flippase GtrA
VTTVVEVFRTFPKFARFLLCGGIAAAVNWASRFAWSAALPFGAAVIAAYATGMGIAFILFRSFVFDAREADLAGQVQRFIAINLLGMGMTWTLANILVFWALPAAGMTSHVEAAGHALAIVAPALTSWFGHRIITFR